MTRERPLVAVHCDAGPARSRAARCLALAEELVLRGVEVVFVGGAERDPWTRAQLDAHGLTSVVAGDSAEAFGRVLDELAADAVVLDGNLSADACAALRGSGRPTLAVVDGDSRGRQADVVVDPNPGAEDRRLRAPRNATVLAGTDFALMRNDVLANRPISPRRHHSVEVPRVVAVLDDADAAGAVLARVLAETGRPFEAVFVAADEGVRAEVAQVRPAPRQRIDVAEPTWRLHERIGRADVVLGPAGSSAYEWLCLGAAVGLVWADEARVEDYRRLMVRRAVVGLGSTASLRDDPASGADKATRLLSDARERTRLAEAGWRLVDGLGRARVADALLALL